MPSGLAGLPRFLVIAPESTVRLGMDLDRPTCEIDLELQNPSPGRSFVVMIGQRGGPFAQRLRLSGKARVLFEPRTAGRYELVLANPVDEPIVLRLRGRQLSARSFPSAPTRSERKAVPHRSRRRRAGAGRPTRRVARPGRAGPHRSVQAPR